MKAMMVWSETLSVGDPELDEQHRVLIGLLNGLYEGLTDGSAPDVTVRLIEDLFAYTRLHFGNEERYFDQFRYEERDSHMKAHRALEEKLMQYRNRLDAGEGGMAFELLNFLRDWIIGHIMQVDSRYRSFFSEVVRKSEMLPG